MDGCLGVSLFNGYGHGENHITKISDGFTDSMIVSMLILVEVYCIVIVLYPDKSNIHSLLVYCIVYSIVYSIVCF